MKKETKGKRRGGVLLAALLSMSITMTGMPVYVYAEGEETVPAGEIQALADTGSGQETRKMTVSISDDAYVNTDDGSTIQANQDPGQLLAGKNRKTFLRLDLSQMANMEEISAANV